MSGMPVWAREEQKKKKKKRTTQDGGEGEGEDGGSEGEGEREGEGEGQEEDPPWCEERVEEWWERIEGVRHKLTRILNPVKMTPYLRQCKVIDEQDEDEVLNSVLYPLRISKAGRLLDILHKRGHRGLQAFMESLEFYHPEQFTQLTGREPTQRCSCLLEEDGPEGLTQFLLLEVRKLREQLRASRVCERRLSQRCRVAEEERSCAERKAQELRTDRIQLERLRQDWEVSSRELSRLKDRNLEQAVKYSRALEEQSKASGRERELLNQVEQLRSRLQEAERTAEGNQSNNNNTVPSKRISTASLTLDIISQLPKTVNEVDLQKNQHIGTQALLDILQQDRREAAEQRQELCSTIVKLQGELESAETQMEKLESHHEQLQLKVQTLQLDWETEQKRSGSYFNQIMELEKERDQALRSRDSLQLEFTDCLLDKNRLRKRITELQASTEQLQRELEGEKKKSRQPSSAPCHHCSHLSLFSEEQCFDPCCSLSLSTLSGSTHQLLCKSPSGGQHSEKSEGSRFNSEENLLSPLRDSEKEINRLSTFPFPPHVNSINRRVTTEFDLDSWGSDETENMSESVDSEASSPSLWDSWTSLQSHLFPPDLISLPPTTPSKPAPSSPEPDSIPSSPVTPTSPSTFSLADDITIVGGNNTGIFVKRVKPGSTADHCGLKEGSELLELQQVLSGDDGVMLSQCTGEVAHFSLRWWTEPSSLKHTYNPEGYSKLCEQMSCPSFTGPDSFYVRVNLDMNSNCDPPCLGVSCNDILHVTDTRYKGKYQWRCCRVDPRTAKAMQVGAGAIPNYNRAQQLLLVKLRTLTKGQKNIRRKFGRRSSEEVRLVKAVSPNLRTTSTSQVLYTLSKRHEDNLIPYSMVQPIQVQSKRPVIFTPSLLSHGVIERLLQPARSGLDFNTCHPEPIPGSERLDKKVFLLQSEQTLGIRLQSIQDIISQDRHCLLELGLGSVEALLRQGIYPIVIHIKPKDKRGRKFKKLLCGRSEDEVMAVCHSEELQLETLPVLYHTLQPGSWSCTEDLLDTIRNAIHNLQRAVVWVELDRLG
ncbi:caspase recruitment domain-containing protein 10 isoform X2 [Engraulis encrasicolus]|uniref:caspase recruitment domain-containing protein 10 isoform X2 n=1 Tax=Engraulis encrasicolus TaxID=184585 RepID=UPI002FCE8F7F